MVPPATRRNDVGRLPRRCWNPTVVRLPRKSTYFAKIERLADLQQKGIVSPEEFAAKKAELLSRL
jgi:hypothetical protein